MGDLMLDTAEQGQGVREMGPEQWKQLGLGPFRMW